MAGERQERARRRRSIRASSKPTARAAASTVDPCPIRCSARSTRSVCWYRKRSHPERLRRTAGSGCADSPRSCGEVGQRQRLAEVLVDQVLRPVHRVEQVGPVAQYRAGLLLVAVPPGVDTTISRATRAANAGPCRTATRCRARSMPLAMPAERDHPVVHHVQHVPDDGRPRIAAGQLVLQIVVGGAPPAVEQTRPGRARRPRRRRWPPCRRRSWCRASAPRVAALEPAGAGEPRRPPARYDQQVVRPSAPATARPPAATTPCAVGTSSCSATYISS